MLLVIARSEATKQSSFAAIKLDCFAPLAMTISNTFIGDLFSHNVRGFCPNTLAVRIETPMTTLTVTAKGRITLHKDLLKHLGVRAGEKIAADKLPGGRIELRARSANGQDFRCFWLSEEEGWLVPFDRGNEQDHDPRLGR
jgi:hypothetical protein